MDSPKVLVVGAGLYVCGDYWHDASINGALASGRRAAEALMRDHSKGTL